MSIKSTLPSLVSIPCKQSKESISFNPQKPLFAEISSIKMLFFSGTNSVIKTGSIERECPDGSIWKVVPSGDGLCTGYDRLVFRALEYLTQQKQNILENPMLIFTYNELIQVINPGRRNNSVSGMERKMLRQSIERIRHQAISRVGSYSTPEYEISVRESPKDAYLIEACGFVEKKTKGKGRASGVNYVVFGQYYLQSWAHHRPQPIYFDYMRHLSSPIAMALFERLQGAFWHGHDVRIKYSELNQDLWLKEPSSSDTTEYRRRARYYLKRPHEELLTKGFISAYSYEPINTPGDKPDFWIIYSPGKCFVGSTIKTFSMLERTSSNGDISGLIKRFHFRRNGKSSHKPSQAELVWMKKLMDNWDKDIEKGLMFINYGVKQLDKDFPKHQTNVVNSLQKYLENFEADYVRVREKVKPFAAVVKEFMKHKTSFELPEFAKRLPIVSCGNLGVQLGKDLKTCSIRYYDPDMLTSNHIS